MDGCTNLLMGRRGHFDKCKYWVCDERNPDLSEYTYEHSPKGIFYAEETTAKERKKLVISNSFMFDEELITIKTKSQVTMKKGDLIEYEEELWIVQSFQTLKINKNNEFMRHPSTISYIQIKR